MGTTGDPSQPTSPSKPVLPRRRFCALVGAFVATSALAISCSVAQPSAGVNQGSPPPTLIGPTILPTVTSSPAPGKLVIVLNGNLQSFDLGTLQTHPITHFPKGAYAASPCLSHDRKSLVYTYYVIPSDPKDLGGSDLYLAGADGSNPKLLQLHPEQGATFENPCWTADDKAVLATLRKPVYDSKNQYQGESLAILRVPIDGSAPTVLAKNAMGPAASADGKYLAYSVVDSQGQLGGLYVGDANATSMRQILADKNFSILEFPTFSPASSRLAFSAVVSPGATVSTPKASGLPLGYGIAEAHGIPWDIWTSNPDGSDLKRLTHESEDTPIPTWSPDGRWIAFAGEIGLYLVDVAGNHTLRLSTLVSGGGVAWPT